MSASAAWPVKVMIVPSPLAPGPTSAFGLEIDVVLVTDHAAEATGVQPEGNVPTVVLSKFSEATIVIRAALP